MRLASINFKRFLAINAKIAYPILHQTRLIKELSMRSFDRTEIQMRPVNIQANISRHAEGSSLIEFGHTKVLCTATIEDRVPHFIRDTGKGWVTAEYGMLPRATNTRNQREAAQGKQSGRTQEIQRLIGRSLRSVMDLGLLGERQIVIDCDVLEADGGTRTAAITGAYVALELAIQSLLHNGTIKKNPLRQSVAAISCGIVDGVPLLDLDYEEDSSADIDANFVMTGDGQIVEIQATGEERSFSGEEFVQMMQLATSGIIELTGLQKQAIQTA